MVSIQVQIMTEFVPGLIVVGGKSGVKRPSVIGILLVIIYLSASKVFALQRSDQHPRSFDSQTPSETVT